MEWELHPDYNPEDEQPVMWPTLPTPLWNHMAIGIESVPSDKIFIFGGQKSPREYSNQVRLVCLVSSHNHSGAGKYFSPFASRIFRSLSWTQPR